MKNVLLFLALIFSLPAFAQESGLFGSSSLTPAQLTAEQQAFTNRLTTAYQPITSTFVTVEDVKTIAQEGAMALTLPDGQQITAKVFRVSMAEENTFVWTGKIENTSDLISIAQNAGGTSGMFTYADRFYSIHPLDLSNSLLIESPISIHEDKVCGMAEQLNDLTIPESECSDGECDNPVIDVLIVWTDEAIAWIIGLGDPFVMALYGALGTESVNAAFANSEISGEIKYKAIRYSNFNYSTNPSDVQIDIDRLAFDPYIQNEREESRADLVILLTNQAYQTIRGSVFGIANGIGPGSAFTIVEVPYLIAPRWTLAHEVGHLLGARHNRSSNGGNDNTNICAHGWRFTGASGNVRRTILALLGNDGGRILHYSNPDVSFDSRATGTSNDDNAGRIDQVSCLAEDYLQPRALRMKISGSNNLCLCFPDSYEEFLNYEANIKTATPPLPGVPPFTYVWHWNTSGIFTPTNPGNFIGNTQSININFNPPCNQFFLHLSITSSDGITLSDTKRINTSRCTSCSVCLSRQAQGNNPLAPAAINMNFSLSPNPATDRLAVDFSLNEERLIQIDLKDIQGKVIYQSSITQYPKGQHTQYLTLENLPPGVYFCSLHDQKSYKTLKFIVQ